jgi:hypothetical protein
MTFASRQKSCLVALLLVLGGFSALAQTTPPPPPGTGSARAGEVPPIGDNAVFYMFLRYQDSLVQQLQAAIAADPTTAQITQQSAAQSLGLSVSDFARVNPVYQVLAATLQAVDADANAYRDAVKSGSKALDTATIKQFSVRRDQAVNNARIQLQQALTPTGWQAISSYIEGQFRQTIVRRSIGQ